MVMLEVLTSYPPYYNIPHNENLAMGICERLKPEIKCEIPQFLKEIMEKCWNFEPFDRPTAKELKSQLDKYASKDEEIRKQVNKQVKAANTSGIFYMRNIPKLLRIVIFPENYDTFGNFSEFFRKIFDA